MQEKVWTGPHLVDITIRQGSSQPPRWALLLIDRVCAGRGRFTMELRWTNSRRGGRGLCFGPHFISVGANAKDDDVTRYIVIHELAHAFNRKGDRHGDGFYDQLVRIARDEGCLRMVTRVHVMAHARAPLTRAVARAKAA
jgi:hypothetical protein